MSHQLFLTSTVRIPTIIFFPAKSLHRTLPFHRSLNFLSIAKSTPSTTSFGVDKSAKSKKLNKKVAECGVAVVDGLNRVRSLVWCPVFARFMRLSGVRSGLQ
ncbi:hypothetical protein Droror1_Dr00002414 [Drosera rotundifolia]